MKDEGQETELKPIRLRLKTVNDRGWPKKIKRRDEVGNEERTRYKRIKKTQGESQE